MLQNNILILGDGLLATELQKQTGWGIISRKKDGFDITEPENLDKYLIEYFQGMASTSKSKIIINCIANIDTYSNEKEKHWKTNYEGVAHLVDFCNDWGVKLVHISTDYIYENSDQNASESDVPVHGNTWYAYTKLLADGYVELKSNNYLICRGTHKPIPFPYKKAWINQIGNFDYVDTTADLIIKLIEKDAKGIYNIGTSLKTMFDLAITTSNDVQPALKDTRTPSDTSMNIDKLNKFLDESK